MVMHLPATHIVLDGTSSYNRFVVLSFFFVATAVFYLTVS